MGRCFYSDISFASKIQQPSAMVESGNYDVCAMAISLGVASMMALLMYRHLQNAVAAASVVADRCPPEIVVLVLNFVGDATARETG